MKKRLLSVILAMCMVFAFGSAAVYAAGPEIRSASFGINIPAAIDLRPRMILTFRTDKYDVMAAEFIKGDSAKTITVPDTFCLGRHTKDVTEWLPVDKLNFTQNELKAGEEIALDYDTVRDLFGVRFSSTVIKMIGQ